MDISVRDWMIIIGVLLIVAVLLDGYRRMRDPNRIRVSLTRVPDGPDDDVSMSRELPNGGARVTARDASAEAPAVSDADDSAEDSDYPTEVAEEPEAPEAPAAPLGEPPLLTEPADGPDPLFDPPPVAAADPEAAEPLSVSADRDSGETLDLLDGISADDEASDAAATPDPDAPSEVLMLHVVSRDEAGFNGEDILQVLLAYNLRFGDMDFFHCHEESAGRGAIQFSVANMLQPGVFDIDKMSDFSTTGLIFFLTLPGPRDMMAAFEQMLDTARGVAENLGGDVLDESRSATTRQTLEHMRQRIRDLERKLLAQAGR